MRLVDEIYETFKYHFGADDEDMYPIVFGLLEAKSREEIFDHLEELEDKQLSEMLTLYVLEQLQKKFAEEGIDRVTLGQDYTEDYLH